MQGFESQRSNDLDGADFAEMQRDRFFDVEIVTPAHGTSAPTPNRGADPAFPELHLLPPAPPELVAAAYRAVALLRHPDRGGSMAAMQKLNAAFGELKVRGVARLDPPRCSTRSWRSSTTQNRMAPA
jgi:hypothetical protein